MLGTIVAAPELPPVNMWIKREPLRQRFRLAKSKRHLKGLASRSEMQIDYSDGTREENVIQL